MSASIRHFRELRVYQTAMETAVAVFTASGQFPKEERFSLTDQVRRSSRSVCTNVAEAWRKRRYPAAFVAKLPDAEAEAAETLVWLEFAANHGYLDKTSRENFDASYENILGMLVRMSAEPEKWALPPK